MFLNAQRIRSRIEGNYDGKGKSVLQTLKVKQNSLGLVK